jgi:hypothetical protein
MEGLKARWPEGARVAGHASCLIPIRPRLKWLDAVDVPQLSNGDPSQSQRESLISKVIASLAGRLTLDMSQILSVEQP